MSDLAELFDEYNILAAFGLTLLLTICSAVGSLLIGTIVAILRVSPVAALRFFGTAYVTLVRNTPLTLIVVFCAFGFLNFMGLQLLPSSASLIAQNAAWCVVALSIYHASFVAEAIRSGINTVPIGQAEAARAIGLNFSQTLGQVVLPQAFRGAIAPLGNTLIALTKNTTVVAAVGVTEAGLMMRNMIEFNPDYMFLIFGIVALGFVILTLPVGVTFTNFSRKLTVQR
ncbi:amino acid ABC transporter permease [Enemella evansiae]|uniref:amino acid ABC transporter permease n=1 Tax=Enemella evansiae TaxID=2016499 RepID=UPI000B960CC0|nr:amino acid ABC transporter permease [Enemella evansiae]OYO00452.1 glutamate ABC transporter permease [Enemella evansiae]OYO05578.1 glutamate ABC transporter permease [Enemella evansiae]OYO15231.1 glutamate ABC transporter permease [Enemella evansiae]PFG66924.1 glutamate transport system permease protein [Propionibacteriaceae bacterium ES.041]